MKDKILRIISESMINDEDYLDMIASSNYIDKEVREILSSILSNKITKGNIKGRKYINSKYADEIENLTIEEAKNTFECKYANASCNSLLIASNLAYDVLLNKGDKVLVFGMENDEYLSSYIKKEYNFISYSLEKDIVQINYNDLRSKVEEEKPNLLLITSSSYPRKFDFSEIKDICSSNDCLLLVNMDHISGLVAAKLYDNPINYADLVITSTNKTLKGPIGALLLTNNSSINNKINTIINSKYQDEIMINTMAAKAIALSNARTDSFKEYQKQVIKNSKILCDVLKQNKVKLVCNGTDNHLLIIDVKKSFNITGKEAEKKLYNINILCNKCLIPKDPTNQFITSGIRLGTSALTSRGLKEGDFAELANIITDCLSSVKKDNELIKQVSELTSKYILYKEGD